MVLSFSIHGCGAVLWVWKHDAVSNEFIRLGFGVYWRYRMGWSFVRLRPRVTKV